MSRRKRPGKGQREATRQVALKQAALKEQGLLEFHYEGSEPSENRESSTTSSENKSKKKSKEEKSRIEKSKEEDIRFNFPKKKKRPSKWQRERQREIAKGPYGGKLPHPIRVVEGGAPDTVQQKNRQKGAR